MPTYEFYCRDCKAEISLALTLKERDAGTFTCPKCKGKNLEPLMSAFSAKTSRKS